MPPMKVLVTGATGFLGGRLAKRLVVDGHEVRALVRRSSATSALDALNVELALGDLCDASSVSAAVDGVDIVVHAGAGTRGTAEDSEATIEGTRNILEGCRKHRVGKLIHVSTCNVYETAGLADGAVVTEESQLERFPQRRGDYTAAKLRAEALVTKAMAEGGLPTVVLRPGTMYGPGGELFTRMMGASFARRVFVVFGYGNCALPLVHVDNAVDAIVGCISSSAANRGVFNVVDLDRVSKRMYMEHVVKRLYQNVLVVYFPLWLLFFLTWLLERLAAILGKEPPLTVYRLASSQRCIRYSAAKIQSTVAWRPRIRFEQGARQLIESHGRSHEQN